MQKNLSIYLDLLRLVAAFAVVLSHADGFGFRGLPWLAKIHGPEAVAVFFVLSGFVIRFATSAKGEADWRTYARRRVARIYPVVLLCLVVTAIADAVGASALPSAYPANSFSTVGSAAWAVVRSMTFTNQIWFDRITPGSNGPFWSLGFEVPYYVAFGFMIFAKGRSRVVLLGIWLLLFGPKVAAYLPLWLLGVITFDVLAGYSGKRHGGLGLFLLGGAVAGYVVIKLGGFQLPFYRIYHPLNAGELIGGAAYYTFVGLLAAGSIAGVDLLTRSMRAPPAWISAAIVWLAGGSFTLYLVHLPLLGAARALAPAVQESRSTSILVLLAVLSLSYLLAEVAERRKKAARKLAARFI